MNICALSSLLPRRFAALLAALLLAGLALLPQAGHGMDKTIAAALADAAADDANADNQATADAEPLADESIQADSRFGAIAGLALQIAQQPYRTPDVQVPDFLRALPLDKWQNIRFKPESSLWRGEGLAFIARFFAPGSIFNRAVTVNIIENGETRPHAFSPQMFDFGKLVSESDLQNAKTSFAGFRILQPAQPPVAEHELATFIGATFFRSKGRHSGYGVFARGLALDLGEPEGEEFPYFREFWLVKPKSGELSLTVYALLDSPRVSGAYKFVITPGASTTMEVSARLYQRSGAGAPKKIGIAPMSSMFLFSETGGSLAEDYRPEVHNSDGLLYSTGGNNWFWRPLANPSRLSGQSFAMQNPAGFGLMQRDSDFDHYLDISERFDRRASLWVEPKGNWGEGHIELIEIPTKTDINSNIHAFWVPKSAPRGDGTPDQPRVFRFDYKLYWMDPSVSPHLLGRAVSTRVVRENHGDIARFIVDFEGEALKSLPADTGLSSIVETPQQAPLVEKHLLKNPVTGGWRLDFRVRVPKNEGVVQSIVTARDGSPPLRFRALLKRGENLPDPLTETWIFDLPTQ